MEGMDPRGEEADELFRRVMLASFMGNDGWSTVWTEQADLEHLKRCETARVSDVDAREGTAECDTGCDYASVVVEITCDHSVFIGWKRGDYGDLPGLIREMIEEEAHG